MFWVELTKTSGEKTLVNLEAGFTIESANGVTLIELNGELGTLVTETPAQIEHLLPFVRRVSEGQQQSDPAVWAELLAAAEEVAEAWEVPGTPLDLQAALGPTGVMDRLRAAIAAARAAQEQE